MIELKLKEILTETFLGVFLLYVSGTNPLEGSSFLASSFSKEHGDSVSQV